MVMAPQCDVEYIGIPASAYLDTTRGCGNGTRPPRAALDNAIEGETASRNTGVDDVLLP